MNYEIFKLLTPRDWAATKRMQACDILGTPEARELLADARKFDLLADAFKVLCEGSPSLVDPNAPWLTEAHLLCNDAGIPPGHISFRLKALRERFAPAPVQSEAGF